MKEAVGNIWDSNADAIVITTNGFVKKDGSCVMGRGIALEAKARVPHIEYWLGDRINKEGNHVHIYWEALGHYNGHEGTEWYTDLVTFPVKHNWWEEADLELIERSAKELFDASEYPAWTSVALPRPGCGNGKLNWEDVKPIIEPYLSDRFTVYSLW